MPFMLDSLSRARPSKLPLHLMAPMKPRVEWVDYAKGICIFFVVMLHVNDVVQEHFGRQGWLEHVVVFARPFRMPDFFLIAGLFLASSMRRPWRRYLDGKVVHFLYFYVMWMTLHFVISDLPNLHERGSDASAIGLEYLRRFIDPEGPLWFIHLLPIFFLITRLTRSVPWWVMWLAAAGLHSMKVDTGWHVPDELSSRYVYFYSGYIFASHVFRIASWAEQRLPLAVAYLVCWGIVNGLVVAAGFAALPIVSLALGYAGALAVILAAVLFARSTGTNALRYIGENSIIIYLGEFVVSALLLRLLFPIFHDVGALAMVATVLTIAGTIGLWQVMIRTPAWFMYRRPRWLRLDGGTTEE